MKINNLSIIFPLYNEEKRLPKLFWEVEKFILNQIYEIEIIFVNDGSTDLSLDLIQKYIAETKDKKFNIKIISYEKNQGKGNAIKQGVLSASNQWILTMDIDLSVSLNQINEWFKNEFITNEDVAYFGSRLLDKSQVKAKKYRSLVGDVFNFLLKHIMNNKLSFIKDTQCGFKLYNSSFSNLIFSNMNEKGYIHDVEILILIIKNKIKVKELPVKWEHKSGSKVNIIKDSFVMFLTLIRLKIKYKI